MDDDILGLVRLEVEELVAGSFLEGAPIVPVSSVTGAGLDDLRRELARVAARVGGEERGGLFPPAHRPRLFGEGLRHGGHRHADLGLGRARSRKWKSIPPGGACACAACRCTAARPSRAVAGQRTAVNLADIEPADLARGDVLSEPGRFQRGDADRLPPRPAALGEAAEASRAGALSFRDGGDRGRGAPARRHRGDAAGQLPPTRA